MVVRETMDVFQHRYYRWNKMLLTLVGLWPYQSIAIRVIVRVLGLSFVFSLFVPQILAIVKHRDDWNYIMECAVPLVFAGFCVTKSFSSVFNCHKMLILLNRIRTDWELWAQDIDVDILHHYAENGRKLTIVCIVIGITTCTVYVIQPIVPKIIDVLLKNGTEAGEFPIPIDYYSINMQDYYFYIALHCYLYALVGYMITIACDAMLVVYVQHGCALFTILGRKLERMSTMEMSINKKDTTDGLKKASLAVEHLGSCIDKHNDAIDYAELIDAAYSWSFFFIVGLNMMLISIIGIQITARQNELGVTIKFICCNATAMTHLFVENYMAQLLMDHSISIRNYILQAEWYRLPLEAQKLLPLMMMRCNIPCKLTAAKMTAMSVETFAAILKTSLSYYTLLRSV